MPQSSTSRWLATRTRANRPSLVAWSVLTRGLGNYPGVTVEKKTGQMTFDGRRYAVVDLPGLYSLAPRSRDEMVVVDLLLGRLTDSPPVDVVLCIVDAANLHRGLYLLGQLLELGLPTVVALNKLDVAEAEGITLDVDRLRCAARRAGRRDPGQSADWASRISRPRWPGSRAPDDRRRASRSFHGRSRRKSPGWPRCWIRCAEEGPARPCARDGWPSGCCWTPTAISKGLCSTPTMAGFAASCARPESGSPSAAVRSPTSSPRSATIGPAGCSTAC